MNFRLISDDYKWSLLGSSAMALVQLFQMILAARILSPTELGLWAVLLMMYRFLAPFVEVFNRTVIKEKNLGSSQINTLFGINFATGVIVAIFLFISADLVSAFFRIDGFQQYVGLFSLIFPAIGLGTLRGSLFQKELHFRRLAIIQVVASLFEFLLFLALLFAGYGLWSLILAFLLRFYLQHLSYLLLSAHAIRFEANFKSTKAFFHFGKFDLGAQLLNYFYSNIDNILVGRLLGHSALGLYSLAWDITVKPVSFFNPVILKVAFPLMSKADNIKRIYVETLKKVALVQLPLYALMGLMMYPLISLIYGQQWTASAGAAVVLCGVALLRAMAEPGASVLAVKGRIDFEFYFQFLNIFVTVCCILLFYDLKPSIGSIAVAMFIAHLFLMAYWFWWIWRNLIKSESNIR